MLYKKWDRASFLISSRMLQKKRSFLPPTWRAWDREIAIIKGLFFKKLEKLIFKRKLKLLALLHLCIFSLDFSNLLLVPRLFSILEQFYSIWNNLILFGTILFFLEQFCSFWNNSIPVGIILFFLEQFYSFWNNFVPFGIILILFSFNIFLYFQAFKNFFFF